MTGPLAVHSLTATADPDERARQLAIADSLEKAAAMYRAGLIPAPKFSSLDSIVCLDSVAAVHAFAAAHGVEVKQIADRNAGVHHVAEIDRRVVFFNGITDTYLLSVEGRCSIEDQGGQLEVTCKIAPDAYKKHFLGLSDNVSYFVEQLEVADADEYRYRVIFKPESIIPNVDLETSLEEDQ